MSADLRFPLSPYDENDSDSGRESQGHVAAAVRSGSVRDCGEIADLDLWEDSMQIKYELIIYWSETDQAFIVEVPELPGCSADGQSYQEAVQNVEGVIQEWIETAQELGRPIPEPKDRLLFAGSPDNLEPN
jgi:predicted RNase H-like HicB family nuclease